MSLFQPFYDPEDLSACVSAGDSIASLNARTKADGLYFPLWRGESQTFGELYLRHRACSRSFRFGLVGDNVLGCRFRLAGGKSVDLGGRVVKNVTGFDLIRFLAGSEGRFGEPESLVIRLRPLAPIQKSLQLSGAFEELESFRAAFMLSPWVHAVDAFDFSSVQGRLSLHLAWSCLPEEEAVFDSSLKALASEKSCKAQEAPLPAHAKEGEALAYPLDRLLRQAQSYRDCSGFLGQGALLTGRPAKEIKPDPLESRFLELIKGLP